MGFPFFKQKELMDCGPTCIKMILKYYGFDFNIEYFKNKSNLDISGLSIYNLVDTSNKIGLKTITISINDIQEIRDTPTPCILHWKNSHFVVLIPQKFNKSFIKIADPSIGIIKVKKDEFFRNIFYNSSSTTTIIYIERPQSNLLFNTTNNNIFIIIYHYLLFHRKDFIYIFISIFFIGFIQFIIPYFTKNIIDYGIKFKNVSLIKIIILAQITYLFGKIVIEYIRNEIIFQLSSKISISLLSNFWQKILRLPISFFYSKQIGDILQRIQDHYKVERFLTGNLLMLLFSFINIIIFGTILFTYNIKIFFAYFIFTILYYLWISFFLNKKKVINNEKFIIASNESTMTMQLIHGIQEIKISNSENSFRGKWESIQYKLFKHNVLSHNVNKIQQIGASILNDGRNIFITYLAVTLVINNRLSLGTMLAIQYILGQLNMPIDQILSFSQNLEESKISLERISDLHLYQNEDFNCTSTLLNSNEDISIKNLSFQLNNNSFILQNITFTIPNRKITAIVGTSGSGKTTLLKILQKFYINYSGDIYINNTDFSKIYPSAWRNLCSSVLQDGFLFNDTILNNIGIGETDFNIQAILQACKIANIHNFIEQLPNGLYTYIGQNGLKLSEGQKQRILIARSVYRKSEYFFFDEATSSLDSQNEQIIYNNFQSYLSGKTVVLVTHRLRTLSNVDNIIVLDYGKIVETGSFNKLVNLKGKFYTLLNNENN